MKGVGGVFGKCLVICAYLGVWGARGTHLGIWGVGVGLGGLARESTQYGI
jgi:hypothetical protein